MWPGKVPGRVTLCSRCYQCGYRAHRKGRVPKLPAHETTPEDNICPPPGTSIANCRSDPTSMLINKPIPVLGLFGSEPSSSLSSLPQVLRIAAPPAAKCVTSVNASEQAHVKVQQPTACLESRASEFSTARQLVPSCNPKGISYLDFPDIHFSGHSSSNAHASSSRPTAFPSGRTRHESTASRFFDAPLPNQQPSFWGKFLTSAQPGRSYCALGTPNFCITRASSFGKPYKRARQHSYAEDLFKFKAPRIAHNNLCEVSATIVEAPTNTARNARGQPGSASVSIFSGATLCAFDPT